MITDIKILELYAELADNHEWNKFSDDNKNQIKELIKNAMD
jgi:hypothetical protein